MSLRPSLRDAVFRFVAAYTAVPYCVLDRRFFEGRSCGQVIKSMAESDPNDTRKTPLLKRHVKAIARKRHSYVQLSRAGARRASVSEKRSEPFKEAALSLHIAKSVFCTMGDFPRFAASREEIVPHLQKDTPKANVPHVFATTEELGHPAILRVYHAVSDIKTSIPHLRQMSRKLHDKPTISKWVRDRNYGLAIMCTTNKNLAAMRDALVRSKIPEEILVVTDLGPTTETLAQLL